MEKEVFLKMDGKKLLGAIVTVMAVVIMVVVSALIVGTLLADSTFSAISIINVTAVSEQFGLFVTGLIAFLAIIGTIVGVVWLVYYVKELFDKKRGLQSITA